MNKIAVYGSLLSGLGNHPLLQRHGAKLLGEDVLEPKYTMVSLGYFPGVLEGGKTPIKVEVYEVDSECEMDLDRLEGYHKDNINSSFYIKKSITTKFGDTKIYIVNDRYQNSDNVVVDGDWRNFKKAAHEN